MTTSTLPTHDIRPQLQSVARRIDWFTNYLMAIARNGDAIAAAPENWLPWNYPKTATPAADAR